ncbi:MAG: gamma carbonic anhydrase family protein [Parasporobacterium sp.]|nr:gamma carbonic anhydrase family protein [Parasporobacterium sp.]
MILSFNGKTPDLGSAAFVAENATLVGDIQVGEGASIWYGAVLRGDNDPIRIGKNTNIQDNTVVHVDEGYPVLIGDDVTIGHSCIIHGCEIGDRCLIGMGAIIMNGAKIGKNSIVGAGALVTENKEFPEGSLIVGSPAKVKSEVTEDSLNLIDYSSSHYVREAAVYSNLC